MDTSKLRKAVAFLVPNPNPAGPPSDAAPSGATDGNEASPPQTGEASGPVGLGPTMADEQGDPRIGDTFLTREMHDLLVEAWHDWRDGLEEDATIPADHYMLKVEALVMEPCEACDGTGQQPDGHCEICMGFAHTARDTLRTMEMPK